MGNSTRMAIRRGLGISETPVREPKRLMNETAMYRRQLLGRCRLRSLCSPSILTTRNAFFDRLRGSSDLLSKKLEQFYGLLPSF